MGTSCDFFIQTYSCSAVQNQNLVSLESAIIFLKNVEAGQFLRCFQRSLWRDLQTETHGFPGVDMRAICIKFASISNSLCTL